MGEQGLILRTTDGGTAWGPVSSDVGDTLRSVSFSGVNGICGGDSQTILYSTDSGASWQIGQSGFFGGGFPGAQMLNAAVGFVAGQNSIFQPLVGATTTAGSVGLFSPSISTVTKAAVMTFSSSIKTQVSFQELSSTGKALLQEQQMPD